MPHKPRQCEIWNQSKHREFLFKAGTMKKKGEEGRDNKNKPLFLYDKQLDLETYPPTKFHSLLHLLPGKQQLLRSYRNERTGTGFLRFTEKGGGGFGRVRGMKRPVCQMLYSLIPNSICSLYFSRSIWMLVLKKSSFAFSC